MTTAAAKNGIVAADTQLSGPNGINRVSKLFRLPDGGVATGAGPWGKAYVALKWLADGEHGDCPDFEGATLMICRPDGSLWMADDGWPAYPLLDKYAAIGCGGQPALVLMRAGKSAKEAVQAVSPTDAHTSGPVETMAIGKPVTTYESRKK